MTLSIELPVECQQTNKFGELYFENINGKIFDKLASKTVFDKSFQSIFSSPETLYILAGSDSNLIFSYLIEGFSLERKGRQFLIVDFQNVLRLQKMPLPGWIKVAMLDQVREILNAHFASYLVTQKIEIVKSLAVQDAKLGTFYDKLYQALFDTMKEVYAEALMKKDNPVFLMSALLNAYKMQFSLSKIVSSLPNKPFLVLGAGPSLDDQLQWIKENQQNFYIIAIARVSKTLLTQNILPDFIVSLDPSIFSYENSREALLIEAPAVLIHSNHVSFPLLSGWRQQNVHFGPSLPWSTPSKETIIGVLPTVVHEAVQAAFLLGAKSVYLSGVDFCFQGDKTHVSGSVEAELGKDVFENIMHVKTYSGRMAETELVFHQSVKFLREQVADYKNHRPEFQVFNLNEDAAEINNIGYLSPSHIDLIRQEKSIAMANIQTLLKTTSEEKKVFLRMTKQSIQAFRRKIMNVSKLSADILKELQKVGELTPKTAKLNAKIDREIDEDEKNFLFQFGSENFGTLLSKDNLYAENNSAIDNLKLYAQAMISTISKVVVTVDETLMLLQIKLKELEPKTPLSELMEGWRYFCETGRHRVWRDETSRVLTEEEAGLYQQADAQFLAEFEQKNSQHQALLETVKESLILIEQRMLKAFDLKDQVAIEKLIEELSLIQVKEHEVDIQHDLTCLAKGYLAELKGGGDRGIAYYAEMISSEYQLIAQKNILRVEMKRHNHEGITACFEKLCTLSIGYMVNYAEYLALINQKDIALQLLDLYLSSATEDYQAWLKYLEFLSDLDHAELSTVVVQLKKKFGSTSELTYYEKAFLEVIN